MLKLTSYNYITNDDVVDYSEYILIPSNTSIINFNNHDIVLIKRQGTITSMRAQTLIPGNDEGCKYSTTPGKNFYWNHWGEITTLGDTVTCSTNYQNKKPELKKITVECDEASCNNFAKYGSIITGDVRICKINDKYYIYSRDLKFFYECNFDSSNNSIHITKRISDATLDGQNYAPLDIINDKSVVYLDWYYTDGVHISKTYDYYPGSFYSSGFLIDTIYYESGYEGLSGIGSYLSGLEVDKNKYKSFYGKTPGFSFTTPHIVYEEDSKKIWIGVGHTKIRNPAEEYPYIEGSKIQIFRSKLHEQMTAKYGDKYKIHMGTNVPPKCHGYIYLMYFYKLILENGKYTMHISDSYLPINMDEENADKYKFSLIFPMGLMRKTIDDIDTLVVTAGEGDFYSVFLSFPFSSVQTTFRHDVRRLNIDDYGYYVVMYKNGNSIISTEFDSGLRELDTIQKSRQNGGNEEMYKMKYLKYKTKYLSLKY